MDSGSTLQYTAPRSGYSIIVVREYAWDLEFSDDFNRATSSDLGADWTTIRGDDRINTNTYYVWSGTTCSEATAVSRFGADDSLAIKADNIGVHTNRWLVFGINDMNDFHYVTGTVSGTPTMFVYHYTGSSTQLDSFTFSATDIEGGIEVRVEDGVLEIWGPNSGTPTLLRSLDISATYTGGGVGLGGTAGGSIDDFLVYQEIPSTTPAESTIVYTID